MYMDNSKPLAEREEYNLASERFQAYYQVLKLTLEPMSLNIVDEMLKARADMEAQQNHYWYALGLAKTREREDRS